MVSSDEINRMLGAKRRGEDPKKELERLRADRNSNNKGKGVTCPNCITQNSVNARFCQECGTNLTPENRVALTPEGGRNLASNREVESAPKEKIEFNPGTKHSIDTVNKDDGGFFAPEKKGIEKGVAGGIILMVIAFLWFFGGLAVGIIFWYPPILFIIGLYALFKGLANGNVSGEKDKVSSSKVRRSKVRRDD